MTRGAGITIANDALPATLAQEPNGASGKIREGIEQANESRLNRGRFAGQQISPPLPETQALC